MLRGVLWAPSCGPCVQTNVFADASCWSGSLDHTVLVVGYQLLFSTPYWVIR